MADLGSKGALKTSIDAKIYTNTTFQVSAEDIRSSFEDTIDTLCGNVVTMASYAALSNLVNNSALEPGNIYVFPYETVSVVGNTPSTLNTSSAGYTPIVEQLAIVAKDSSSFFGQARSLNYPLDIISYDFTDNVETVTSTSRSGFIKFRKDTVKNVEAFFDIRNNYVVRYGLNKPTVSTPTTKSKGDVIYFDVNGSSVATGWYFVNIGATDIISEAEANPDALSPITEVDENMYSSTSQIGNTVIAIDGTTFAYHQSIDVLSKNITIKENAKDILITNSTGIEIGQGVSKTVIHASSNTTVGGGSYNVIIKGSSAVDVGESSQNIFYFLGTSFESGFLCRNILCIGATSTTIGSWSERVVSINGSVTNTVGASSTAIYFVKDARYNTVGLNGANITIFKGSNNSFEQNCTSIQIYGGSNNRFAQSCTLINMLGDRDEILSSLGTAYTSPYSKMDNNTFGSSCSNISFVGIGGRGNTFGDECANLTFTNPSVSSVWRLIGCDFCRGIRNKTFQSLLNGISFIVPNQETATITEGDWYVPVLFIGANSGNIAATISEPTLSDPTINHYPYEAPTNDSGHFNDGKRLTAFGSNTPTSFNPISIGYQRTNSFFDNGGGQGKAARAGGSGTEIQNTDAEYRLFGPPTNKAFQWTHNGYPLCINFINATVPNLDATRYLTTDDDTPTP